MTTLSTFNVNDFTDIAVSKVDSISATRLYYVTTGRNAWHSTKIHRYSEGCMHATLKSAKDYVEKKRVQGTEFNIKEIPSIVFRSPAGDIVITQINTMTPLGSYSPDALSKANPLVETDPHVALDNYIHIGASMFGVVMSFRHKSRFWTAQQQESNAVIVVATRDKSIEFNNDLDVDFKQYYSHTNGAGYRLGWNPGEIKISAAPIYRILSDVTDEV